MVKNKLGSALVEFLSILNFLNVTTEAFKIVSLWYKKTISPGIKQEAMSSKCNITPLVTESGNKLLFFVQRFNPEKSYSSGVDSTLLLIASFSN